MNNIISVVIVNWNSGKQLSESVESLIQFGDGFVLEIVVVDNGSIDGSERIADKNTSVTLIRARNNLGFAKACNLGARKCTGEFLLFLNPDAILYSGALERILEFIRNPENSQVGVCGVQLLDEYNNITRSCSRFPTFLRLASHLIGVSHFFPKSGYFMAEWSHEDTREVDHVIGAFYLVRRNIFEQLGGFDERFFVYLEDLDFSRRVHQAGWKTVFLATAQAFHAGGGTSSQVKAKRLFYSLRSRLLYGFKHFQAWQAWIILLLTCMIEPVTRIVYFLLKRDWKGVENTFSGYNMLFCNLSDILKNKSVSGE